MKRKKLKDNRYWRKKSCILAKQIVRRLAKYTCAYCGKSEPQVATHGSHVYPEGTYRNMSADLDNIITLCFSHHTGGWNGQEPSWHKDPITMAKWFNDKYPELAKTLLLRTQTIYDVDFAKKYLELKEIWDENNH